MLAQSTMLNEWTPDRFGAAVQEVLDHLYDAAYLRQHALVDLLVLPETDPLHRSQEARRLLLQAIEALRPVGAPAQSTAWRAYRILELRYIEGLTARQTMDEIALGRSHFYREHLRILEALTGLLWEQVTERLRSQQVTLPAAAAAENRTETPKESQKGKQEGRASLVHREVERLCAQADWKEINLAGVVADLQPLAQTLAEGKDTLLEVESTGDLILPKADWTLARQALLNAITYGLDRAPGGHMTVAPIVSPNFMGIVIHTQTGREADHKPLRQGIGLQVCEDFVRAMGGWVEIDNQAPNTWTMRLLWPIVQASTLSPPVLLVIDDNKEFLELFRRYLAGHPWQVVGAINGDSARRLAHELQPKVSLLDVMLPKEDGWEILRRFKAEPATQELPVIVCSVLNEPQVATTLGAAGYLLKPVTQRALLQALAPWRATHAMPPPTRQA